ncbi:MAG: NAD(P)/FAD-dependent oxidoreductase [Anaerolineae bacterium]|nr:NAD(P)/FAD-dependent oxidoreductase [Anaerolineae bacterium]
MGTVWLALHSVTPTFSTPKKVLIIGAGASGIAAASRLKKAGFDVTILEARNRIGGRIWTDYETAHYPIELGAEFIHGSEVVTWQLLKQHHLKTNKALKDKQIYVHLNNTVGKLDKLVPDDWEDDIWESAEDWLDRGESDTSLRQMLDSEKWLTPQHSEIAKLVNNFYACDYGADLSMLGFYGLLEASYEGDSDEEGDFRVKKGYTALIEKMAENLDIRLNTPVLSIDYSSNGVTISDKNKVTYTADKVLVTLPLGILQSGDVEFLPNLPQYKIKAIHGIGVGKVNKVILGFNEPFWKKKMAAVYTHLDSQIWWRPGFEHESSGSVLTALMGGDSGARYSEMSEQEAIDAALGDLCQIFGKEAQKAYRWGRFINWGTDPYSKMGYSYNPVGVVGLRKVLAENIAEKVYFAGEATNTIRPATVHGAIESGWRAADEMIASSSS